MKIDKKSLREDFSRDTYWTRIHFESDDQKKRSTVLICASQEYLEDFFHVRELDKIQLDQWLQNIIKKWESLDDKIFEKEIHYDVYANTPEGVANGSKFLQEEVKP